jgi:NAD(P)-dependent dehydrogenase (short-subunit alcohol dehydrogenase family)/catechol 2,3-dioxygenase-like lactoylglutathione lyase family enzyme
MLPSSHLKIALITGASRGLGLALAQALAERGWQLVITARGREALEAARERLARVTRVVALAGDIAEPAARAALAQAVAALGPLDLLVNNAGTLGPSPRPALLDLPLESLDALFHTNVTAQLGLIQALAHHFSPYPTLVNITSDAAVEAYAGWGGYGGSKAALEHLGAILAAERPAWRVLTVDPGDMRTQMHQDAFPGEDISDRPLPETSVPGLLALIEGEAPSSRYRARQMAATHCVHALNLVLTTRDFDAALRYYRDALGLPVLKEWHAIGHGVQLDAGRAMIELIDETQATEVDQVEVGQRSAGPVRLAISVTPLPGAQTALTGAGAEPLGAVVDTPWGHRNVRLSAPDGLQVTLYDEIILRRHADLTPDPGQP